VFYASKFYTLTRVLNVPFGSALAFRLVAATMLVAKVYHVRRAAKAVCPDRLFRTILTFAVAAEIFPVITIYEREALTGFAAFVFLTMSACTFTILLLRMSKERGTGTGWYQR
jgi:4-amino-4-deoxy-L-arabinose transferase-like glycosyltransferase